MNDITYSKYCPNVFLAASPEQLEKGDIIDVVTKYGKENQHEVHNFIYERDGIYHYSITRCDGLNAQTYAEKKAEKYKGWAGGAIAKSDACVAAANEGRDFLSLGEPIKVGHHSEKRHRALIERNNKRMERSIEHVKKAERHAEKAAYWEDRTNTINLSMPESIGYFEYKLEQAIALQKGYKDGTIEREHSYSLSYATKDVKELKKKLATAIKLWGDSE